MTLPPRDYLMWSSNPRVLIVENGSCTTKRGRPHILPYGRAHPDLAVTLAPQDSDTLPLVIIVTGNTTVTTAFIRACQQITVNAGRRHPTQPGIQVLMIDLGTGAYETLCAPNWSGTDKPLYELAQMECMAPIHGLGGKLHETTGLDIHRYLITEKIKAEIAMIENTPGLKRTRIMDMRNALHKAETADTHKVIESAEGNSSKDGFWRTMVGLKLIKTERAGQLPDEWYMFTRRTNHREARQGAIDPYNALYNLAMSIATMQCVVALRAIGLNPKYGVDSHRLREDERKYCLAYNLVEPLRPLVWQWCIQYLTSRKFTKDDFIQKSLILPVSCGPQVVSDVLASASHWFTKAAPYAERVGSMLHDACGIQRKRYAHYITRAGKIKITRAGKIKKEKAA